MKLKKFDVLSSYALATTVTLCVALMSGCDRREEVYPVEGNAYVHDPAYRAQLDAQVKERDQLVRSQREVRAELDKLLKKYGNNIAVTNSPEGAALYAALLANREANVSNRMHTAEIMRERKQRAIADSERIKRGEAKAIDISKKKEAK